MVIKILHVYDETFDKNNNPDLVSCMYGCQIKAHASDTVPYTIYASKDKMLHIQFDPPDPNQQTNTIKPKDVVYFEVTILEANSSAVVLGVGFTSLGIVYGGKMGMVGWWNNSVGYHGDASLNSLSKCNEGDDGHVIDGNVEEFAQNPPSITAPSYGKGAVIGAAWNISTGNIFFTLNGKKIDSYTNCKNTWTRSRSDYPDWVATVTSEEVPIEFTVNNGTDLVNKPYLVDILYKQFASCCLRCLKYARVVFQPANGTTSYLNSLSPEIKSVILQFVAGEGATSSELQKVIEYARDRSTLAVSNTKEQFLNHINPNRNVFL